MPRTPRVDEPALPDNLDLGVLPRGVRAELRGLSPDNADRVGEHLVMAGRLIDEDPAAAYAHAKAARGRASRLPVVREACAEAAYAAGDYAGALNEYRTLRRMTGAQEYLAVMADCERGLGRPQAALKLVKEGMDANPPVTDRVELRLVEAGARVELGQIEEASRLLRSEIELIGPRGSKLARARLRYGFADLLLVTGETEQAEQWFNAAVRLDPEDLTGAAERLAELHGVLIHFDEADEPAEDELAEDEPAEDQADQEQAGEAEASTDE